MPLEMICSFGILLTLVLAKNFLNHVKRSQDALTEAQWKLRMQQESTKDAVMFLKAYSSGVPKPKLAPAKTAQATECHYCGRTSVGPSCASCGAPKEGE